MRSRLPRLRALDVGGDAAGRNGREMCRLECEGARLGGKRGGPRGAADVQGGRRVSGVLVNPWKGYGEAARGWRVTKEIYKWYGRWGEFGGVEFVSRKGRAGFGAFWRGCKGRVCGVRCSRKKSCVDWWFWAVLGGAGRREASYALIKGRGTGNFRVSTCSKVVKQSLLQQSIRAWKRLGVIASWLEQSRIFTRRVRSFSAGGLWTPPTRWSAGSRANWRWS